MAGFVTKHWKGEYVGSTRKERTGGAYYMYRPDFLADRAFMLDGETAADVSDTERAIIELNNNAQALSNTEVLARLILRAEALSSSRIEGLVIGARRIMKAEIDGQTNDVTAQEVINNISAMDEALRSSTSGEITLETLKAIHSVLLMNTQLEEFAGKIRTEQNWIGGNAHNPCGAAFVPPAPELVPELLQDLVRFCNEDRLSPLTQAAVAHAQFETIHPFVDGNGRTGRALIHLILRRRGLCPNVVPPISLVIATMGKGYVKELSLFRHNGSVESAAATEGLNSYIAFFAGCTLRSCNDAQIFENRIAALKQQWLDQLGPKAVTVATLQIIDAMIGQPLFNTKLMEQTTGKSAPTINATIEKLTEAGIVKQTNAGKRNRVFEAVGVLGIFTDFERQLASPADDTETEKPSRPVPFRSS